MSRLRSRPRRAVDDALVRAAPRAFHPRLTLSRRDSFESHVSNVHGSPHKLFCWAKLTPCNTGLLDYIAFIAMIILKDRSSLTGNCCLACSARADVLTDARRARVCRVQLHSGRHTFWRAAKGQARYLLAALSGSFGHAHLGACSHSSTNTFISLQRLSSQVAAKAAVVPAASAASPLEVGSLTRFSQEAHRSTLPQLATQETFHAAIASTQNWCVALLAPRFPRHFGSQTCFRIKKLTQKALQ